MITNTETISEKIQDEYYENIIPDIFGKNHIKLKSFEDYKNAQKYGKITLNIAYSAKLAKELLPSNNYSFYNGITMIKNLGAIGLTIYVLIAYQDYKFLFLLPIALLLNFIILSFWKKRLLTFCILMVAIIGITTYFELNIFYKIFLIGYCLLEAISFSAYSSFLSEYFSKDEITFGVGIEQKLILQIYDSYTKTTINNLK